MRRLAWLALSAGIIIALASVTAVPITRSGSGAAGIAGYAISSVTYIPSDADPQLLAAVEFDLDYPAGQVMARLRADGPWSTCQNISGNRWRCPFSGEPISASALLTVVAAQGISSQGQGGSLTVSGIAYSLSSTAPNSITGVTLTLSAPVYSLSARLNPSRPWTACSLQTGTTWSCPATASAVTSTSTAILSQLELLVQETATSSPTTLLVATYSYSGADKAQALAPSQCAPIRSSLQGVKVQSGSSTISGSYTGPSQLVLGSSLTETLVGSPGNDCMLTGGFNNVCCDVLYGGDGDDVLIITSNQDSPLYGEAGYDRCYGPSIYGTAYGCEEVNGRVVAATVDRLVLNPDYPRQLFRAYITINLPPGYYLYTIYIYNGASNSCSSTDRIHWTCNGSNSDFIGVSRVDINTNFYGMKVHLLDLPNGSVRDYV